MKTNIVFEGQAYVFASEHGDHWTDLGLVNMVSVHGNEVELTVDTLVAEQLASIVPDPWKYLPPKRSGSNITMNSGLGTSSGLVNVSRFELQIRPSNMEDDKGRMWIPSVKCLNFFAVANMLMDNQDNVNEEFTFVFRIVKPLEWISPVTGANQISGN